MPEEEGGAQDVVAGWCHIEEKEERGAEDVATGWCHIEENVAPSFRHLVLLGIFVFSRTCALDTFIYSLPENHLVLTH